MMKKRLLLSLAVLMGLTSAMATDVITSSDFNISPGETKTFAIKLSNEVTNYVGFQMDLTLPEGLAVNKAGCSLSDRITDDNQELTIGKQGENTYRLTSTSFSLTPISGTSGDLINVSVTASNTYQGGNATISNILFATSNSESVTMSNVALSIYNGIISFADEQVKALCVSNWDTNGDGELDTEEAASVTSLGSVFSSNSDITSFDELQYFTGLTSIGRSSFYGCSDLASITIPSNVESISDYAFLNCSSLTSITIPNHVWRIGERAFDNCSSLTSMIIPDCVTDIGYAAFYGCSDLTSITIPESVRSVGHEAFVGTAWYNNLPDGLIYIGKVAYQYKGTMPENTSVAIAQGTVSITSSAFANCSGLTSITIPNSVTTIGASAFWPCPSLTSITIPESVKHIGDYAFSGCSGLTSITVNSENTVYDSRDNCNAIIEKTTNTLIVGCQNTSIPNSVTSIGRSAFFGCSDLTSITIPNNVSSIGYSAFQDCSSLTSITIPNSVTTIDNYAFSGCSGLTSITVNSENTVYDSRDNCNAIIEKTTNTLIVGCQNTSIPNSVTSIGGSAFSGCSSLTSIIIPDNVSSIGYSAFQDCSSLTSIIIPNSVTTIDNYAFGGCSSLTSMVVDISSPLTINSSTFYFNINANATLYVPKNCKTAYAEADYWKEFKAIKEFPDPDVNQDGYVDVVDVVDVARFVVGTPSESFDQFLADLNGSGEVNVADAVVLVNEIAGDVNWSRPMRVQTVNDGLLTLTKNTDESLSLSLDGNSAYTAFQFDLMMPKEMDVTQMTLNSQRKKNHMLLYNKICEGHYRVVALSISNQSFNDSAGELLCMAFDDQPTDDIVIDNIHFVTPQGNDLLFSAIGISGDTPTGISGVSSNVTNSDGKIYNLNGQRLTKAQKGLYIINGKKVLVK